MNSGLSRPEIMKVVNRYIGVSGGYLGDFSYSTHADFYIDYCELDIDPYALEGTTRERFITILQNADPSAQAKIIRGILARFSVRAEGAPASRTPALHDELLEVARRLEGMLPVATPHLQITSAVVERAIRDAETLIQAAGATSGVDRIHTALHGYLLAVCSSASLPHAQDATLTTLFKLLRQGHPTLQDLGPRSQDITQVMKALSSIMDTLLPVRNKASVAHPNETLLEKEEAMLVLQRHLAEKYATLAPEQRGCYDGWSNHHSTRPSAG